MRLIGNILAFQAGWFACVLGAAAGRPALGSAIALVVVTVHVATAPHPPRELLLVAAAAVVGLVADTALLQLGVLSFPTGTLIEGVTPYWMLALWMVFATTLNVSLGWLRDRPLLAMSMGVIAGPLAYLAGARLGALVIVSPMAAAIGVACVYAIALPLLLALADRLRAPTPAARPLT